MTQLKRDDFPSILTFWAMRKGIDARIHSSWLAEKAALLACYAEVYQREQAMIDPCYRVLEITTEGILKGFGKSVDLEKLKKLITAMPLQVLYLDAPEARAIAELHHFLFAAWWEAMDPPDTPYPKWCGCKICQEAGLLSRRIEHVTQPIRLRLDDWALLLAMRTRSYGHLRIAEQVVTTMAMHLARLAAVHCRWLGGRPPRWQRILARSKQVPCDKARCYVLLGRLLYCFPRDSGAEIWEATVKFLSGDLHQNDVG